LPIFITVKIVFKLFFYNYTDYSLKNNLYVQHKKILVCEFWVNNFIYLQLKGIVAGMIISIVSASVFSFCVFLCCNCSSKSRV